MTADDLVQLFADPPVGPGQAVTYRQGLVIAWNPLNAENTIRVGGTDLANLPILNTQEALLLIPGDVVGLLTAGPSWAILGRLTIPGTAGAASALQALAVYAAFDTTNGSTTTNGYVDLTGTSVGPAVDATIGPSGRAKVTLSCQMESTFDPTLGAKCAMGFGLSGANTLAAANDKAFVAFNSLTGAVYVGTTQHYISRGSYVHYLSGLAAGATTFTAKYSSGSSGTTASFSDRSIFVEPL